MADLCVDCGVNPRPYRTNWDKLPVDIQHEVAEFHHRCSECHAKAVAAQDAVVWSYFVSKVKSSPSRHLVKRALVSHCCDVCTADIGAGTSYWRITIPGPRTAKVCEDCVTSWRVAAANERQ